MLKQIYKYMAAWLLLGWIISCSPEPIAEQPLAEGDVPVELNGVLTRALGYAGDLGDGKLITSGYPLEAYRTAGVKFQLTARTTDVPPKTYFTNHEITIGAKNTTDEGRNKLDGAVYYPLGKKDINLFSHTGGQADASGNITLTAGTAVANDILFGKGSDVNGNWTVGGTPGGALVAGNSENPIKYITYKHLMTRVDVKIEVDQDASTGVQPTIPTSIAMKFSRTAGQIVDRGTYNIFTGGNEYGNAVSAANADFSFSGITTSPKTYYLVPNGTNLTTYTGQILSELKINDYTASADDLKAFKFSQADKGGTKVDFKLKPGLAYDLTFVIKRLKITEIKLTLKDWTPRGGSTEWGYVPKPLTLSSGTGSDYTFNDNTKITKLVLKYKHTDNQVYQYIGQGTWDNTGSKNQIDFVTLPADLSTAGTLTADLYTNDGLLAEEVSIESSGTDLKVLNLGKYGTKKNGDVYEISTPLQFALFINDASKGQNLKYKLVHSIDLNNTSVKLQPKDFPSGAVFDGNGQDILHLNLDGNGLFTVNNGMLKNFRIASGLITGSGTDAIGSIAQTNNGTIEAVVNDANIQPASGQLIAGGIVGINGAGGTILAAVNTGNVLGGTTVGGIAGQNNNSGVGAVKATLNVGMLNKSATNLGGIIGNSVDGTAASIVNTSFWLAGTAREAQGVSNEVAIGNSPANGADDKSADLAASVIRSTRVIGDLNTAASTWTFGLDTKKSSWPIAITTQP
ncbi:fimbrillin family protein [Limibacterium fermenti]|uniref:fimbrillin family protein n=1 Tax=Limibacterium fermenti TaxID=3229863 RepID=UPI003A65F916